MLHRVSRTINKCKCSFKIKVMTPILTSKPSGRRSTSLLKSSQINFRTCSETTRMARTQLSRWTEWTACRGRRSHCSRFRSGRVRTRTCSRRTRFSTSTRATLPMLSARPRSTSSTLILRQWSRPWCKMRSKQQTRAKTKSRGTFYHISRQVAPNPFPETRTWSTPFSRTKWSIKW